MRVLRGAPLLLVLTLLFPLGASMPLACCAGVGAGSHGQPRVGAEHCGGGGGGCCERAAQDAAARHCCAGGDAFERPQIGHQAISDAAPAALDLPSPLRALSVASFPSPRDPVPRLEPLYSLHSSLLI